MTPTVIAMETHHHGDMKAIHSAQGPTLCMRVESTKWTVSTGSFGRSLKMADRNPANINHREHIHSTTQNSQPSSLIWPLHDQVSTMAGYVSVNSIHI